MTETAGTVPNVPACMIARTGTRIRSLAPLTLRKSSTSYAGISATHGLGSTHQEQYGTEDEPDDPSNADDGRLGRR